MKYMPLLWLLICCLYNNSYSQGEIQKQQDFDTISIRTTLDFNNGQASDSDVDISKGFVKNLSVGLQDGDLIIEYELNEKGKGLFELQLLSVNSSSGVYDIKPELLYGDIGKKVTKKDGSEKSFVIANTPGNDNIKWLNGQVEFKIGVINSRTIFVKDDKIVWECTIARPEQSPSDYLPEIVFGGIGIATYSIGECIDGRSDELYADYESQDVKLEADGVFEDANEKHQAAFVTKGVGIAFFVVSAIFAVHRHKKHKRHEQFYDKYCKGLSLEPYYEINDSPAQVGTGSQIGFSLKYNF